MAVQPQDVLDFWFDPAHAAHWFAKDAAFDEQIRRRFAAAAAAAAQEHLDAWADSPADWLALLILLDQFPRNLHRGEAQAWAVDVKAQRVALSGLADGFDQALRFDLRFLQRAPHGVVLGVRHRILEHAGRCSGSSPTCRSNMPKTYACSSDRWNCSRRCMRRRPPRSGPDSPSLRIMLGAIAM